MTGQRMCNAVRGKQDCFTLDDLLCTDKTKCLKWGSHSYAGSLSLPPGLEIQAWQNYKCGAGDS